MNKETERAKRLILEILNDRKDNLRLSPELIVDELIELLSEDAIKYILDTSYNCDRWPDWDQRAWDRYILPQLLSMT